MSAFSKVFPKVENSDINKLCSHIGCERRDYSGAKQSKYLMEGCIIYWRPIRGRNHICNTHNTHNKYTSYESGRNNPVCFFSPIDFRDDICYEKGYGIRQYPHRQFKGKIRKRRPIKELLKYQVGGHQRGDEDSC